MNLVKQKYKYDCWVAAVYNLLKLSNIDYDYSQLKIDLNTTSIWWTFPKNIQTFLSKYNLVNFDYSIILVSSDKFYSDDNQDYWHYVNIIWFENDKYKIFDPWDWLYYQLSIWELKRVSENVLVWKNTRFNNITFWKVIF